MNTGARTTGRAASGYTLSMRIRTTLAALALLAWLAPSIATANGPPEAHAPLSLDGAVELVKKRYEARVLRAEEAKEGEEPIYRIRLLAADGRVFTVKVYARTGRME
jgi:uncharacterized membrane protein YkoI